MANQNAGQVIWNLDLDNSKFGGKLRQSREDMKSLSDTASKTGKSVTAGLDSANFGNFAKNASQAFGQAADGLEKVLKRVTLVAAATGVLGGVFVKSAADLQKTNAAFQVLIGNTEEANKLFGQLKRFADITPFEFPELAKSTRLLLGYGVAAEDAFELTRRLGDAAGATGGDLQGITLAFSQMIGRGKVTGDNLRQLTENMVTLRGELSQVTGIPIEKLDKAMEAGELSARELVQALILATNEGGKFFGGTDKLAQTFSGRMSTLKDAFMELGRNLLGVKVDPSLGLMVEPGGLFDRMSQMVVRVTSALQQIGPTLKQAFDFIIRNGSTIVSILAALAAMFVAAKVAAIGFAIASFVALSPVAAIIVALIGLVTFLALKFGILGSIQNKVKGAFAGTTKGADQLKDTTEKLNKAIGTDTPAAGGKASKAMQDLAEKLADIDRNMKFAVRDFNESLTEMIKGHQDKVGTLSRQLQKEVDDFEEAQAEKEATFKKTMAEMTNDHEKRVKDIEKDMKKELKASGNANSKKMQELMSSLNDEQAEYEQSTKDKTSEFEKETEKAKAEHEQRVAETKKELDEEKALLEKHAADVASIRNVMLLDEIDKIKRAHQEQMDSFERQKQEAMKVAQEKDEAASAGVGGGNISDLLTMPDLAPPAAAGGGTSAIDSLKEKLQPLSGIFNSVKDAATSFFNYIKAIWTPAIQIFSAAIGPIVGALKSLGKTIAEDVWPSVKRLWDAINPGFTEALKLAGAIIAGVFVVGIMAMITAADLAWQAISFVIDVLAQLVQWIGNVVGAIINLGKEIGGGVMKIIDWFGKIPGAVGDVIGKVVDFFKGLGSKIGGAVSNVGDFITSPFKTAFNYIADFWNNTMGKVDFHIPDWVPGVGGKGFSFPKMPKLATGGIIDQPTTALIGEAGPEVVIPLDKLPDMVNNMEPREGSNKQTINQTNNIYNNVDMEKSLRDLSWRLAN